MIKKKITPLSVEPRPLILESSACTGQAPYSVGFGKYKLTVSRKVVPPGDNAERYHE